MNKKTKSELLFEQYLDRIGVRFDYEAKANNKQPDYWLKDRFGEYEAVIDVTDLTWPQGLRTRVKPGDSLALGFDSYKAIRKKIKKKAQQFKDVRGLPCLVVLYDAGYPVELDGDAIYGAMMGDLAIEIATVAFPNSPRPAVIDERLFFGGGGTMLNPHTGQAQHTRFAGIAVLEEVFTERHRSGYASEIAALIDHIERSLPEGAGGNEILRLYSPGYEEITAKYLRRGVNLDKKVPRLRMYRNPDAQLPWPAHLVSDADEVWGPNADGTRFVKLFDGLESGTTVRSDG